MIRRRSTPSCCEEIVDGPEYDGDIPATAKALDQLEEEAWPCQKLEARQKEHEYGVIGCHVGWPECVGTFDL
jgi:hypothetical protein